LGLQETAIIKIAEGAGNVRMETELTKYDLTMPYEMLFIRNGAELVYHTKSDARIIGSCTWE